MSDPAANIIPDPVRKARHDVRGRFNALKMSVYALDILRTRQDKLDFLRMIDDSAAQTISTLDHLDAVMAEAGLSEQT